MNTAAIGFPRPIDGCFGGDRRKHPTRRRRRGGFGRRDHYGDDGIRFARQAGGGAENRRGAQRLGLLTDLAISIPLGLVVFYAACRLLRASELELATRALAYPLARRPG